MFFDMSVSLLSHPIRWTLKAAKIRTDSGHLDRCVIFKWHFLVKEGNYENPTISGLGKALVEGFFSSVRGDWRKHSAYIWILRSPQSKWGKVSGGESIMSGNVFLFSVAWGKWLIALSHCCEVHKLCEAYSKVYISPKPCTALRGKCAQPLSMQTSTSTLSRTL